jgi:hypothetical protein
MTLEEEVLEKWLLLDEEAQQRVLAQAEAVRRQRAAQWQAWFADVEQLKAQLRQDYPNGFGISAAQLVHEAREDDEM